MSEFIDTKVDFSRFDQGYNNDETGAPAYEPRILMKIVLYGYSQGLYSSRDLHNLCRNHITMKALAENQEPYWTTIARFISGNGEEITKIFTEVLYFCNELNLIGKKMFAVDGCKLPSNASKEWSGTKKELRKKREKIARLVRKLIEQHRDEDRKDGGKKDGDEKAKFAERIKRYEEQIKKLDDFDKTNAERMGSRGKEVQSNITDNESAKILGPHGVIQGYNGIAVADSENQVIVAAEVFGSVYEGEQFPHMLGELEGALRGISKKEEPLKGVTILADTGYFSEDNLQAAKKKKMKAIIPDPQFRKRDEQFTEGKYGKYHKEKARYDASDFTYVKKENRYICPAGKELAYKGISELNSNRGYRYVASTKDCQTCPKRGQCIKSKTGKNRVLYIPIKEYDENLCEKMKKQIDDPKVRKEYGRRMQIIEPVFSDMTYCKGMDRFTLRGKEKVNIQWMLYCIVHNLGKCMGAMRMGYEG
jgi:transposase/stalled ribosome alternative rescue factor ArfA